MRINFNWAVNNPLSKLVIIFLTNNLIFRLVAATIVNNTSKYTPNGHWVICFRGKRAIDPSIKLLSKCKRDGDQLVCEHIWENIVTGSCLECPSWNATARDGRSLRLTSSAFLNTGNWKKIPRVYILPKTTNNFKRSY